MGPTRDNFVVELLVVAMAALAAVGFGVWGVGIGSAIHPMFGYAAMDEVMYGHAAAHMVSTGHWGTSIYLGRLLLNKPPLLMWAGAIAMRVLGTSPYVLRLPAVLAGALCCALLYLWMRRSRQSATVALVAMVLLASDPFFHVMARRFMTDIFLTLWITLAGFLLAFDPGVKKFRTAAAYGILSGAAIMTKSAAGFIPLVILATYWLVSGAEDRPPVGRMLIAFGSAIVVAAPWHIYQFVVHRDWFVTEYLSVQLIGTGITHPTTEGAGYTLWYYPRALLLSDPILVLMAVAAVPGALMAWRGKDKTLARILIAWIVSMLVCLTAFANRVPYYALPLIPALALFGARFAPGVRSPRTSWLALAILLALFCVKTRAPDRVWGLDFREGATAPSAHDLDAYSRLRRGNELVIVSPDDQTYSSVIDLPKVRYAWISPSISKNTDFFYWLGIIVTADEFCRPVHAAVSADRLAAWHAPDASSIASVIMTRSSEELKDTIRCSPQRDFFLPDDLLDVAENAALPSRTVMRVSAGRFFLLAADTVRRPEAAPAPGVLIVER